MQITHKFVSDKDDGPDSSLVRPSDWNANHALARSVRVVAVNTLLGEADDVVLVNGGVDGVVVSLPSAVGLLGASLVIKKIDDGAEVVVNPNGTETVDGYATYVLVNLNQYVEIVSDGTNWQVIANN